VRVPTGTAGAATGSPGPSQRERGIQELREGNVDEAINLLIYVVAADAKDADATALLGVAYSQKGLHDPARRALQTAVELRPEDPSYRFNLGAALERAGDAAGAAREYTNALRLHPEYAQARRRLQALQPVR
jgi:Flp pilus assembly protein TadD